MGFRHSLSGCCCQFCEDCCNGTPTAFDVTITLTDDKCGLCDSTIGGTYSLGELSSDSCSNWYSNWNWFGDECSTVAYESRILIFKAVSLSVRCDVENNNWIVRVYMTLATRINNSYGYYTVYNRYLWEKTISAAGAECADICDDFPLTEKIRWVSIGLGPVEWICNPGAINDLTCNVCAVP